MSKQESKKAEEKVKDTKNPVSTGLIAEVPKDQAKQVPAGTANILAILDDSVVSKFMIRDMANKGVAAKTEVKTKDISDVEAVQKLIIAEREKNQYDTVYLPVTNTEFNKNSNKYTKIRNESGVSVNFYFDGHDEEEVIKRANLQGIKEDK